MAVTRHGCLRLASRAPGLAAGLQPGRCVSRLRSALSLTSLPAAQTRRNMSPSLPPTDPRVVFSCGAIYEDAAGNAGVQAPGARARVSGTAGRRAGRPRGRGWFPLWTLLGAISWDGLGQIDLESGVNLFPGAGGLPWKRGTGPRRPGDHPSL